MSSERRQIAWLAAAQALLLTQGVTLIVVNGLLGLALAPDRRLATLPVSTYVIGAALTTLPASHFMKRHGRRRGFLLGALLGAGGAALGAAAIYGQSFWALCAATTLSGAYNAFGQYYRFAAADLASVEWKSRAVSLTLAGGIVGGFLGPRLATFTRDLLAPRFIATYVGLLLLSLLAFAITSRLLFPEQSSAERADGGRPLREIAAQPAFLVAVLSSCVGYGVMNLLMSATPIAMDLCGFGFDETGLVLQWHVVGMFAPSFFTGSLVRRFGVLHVLLAGALAMLACAAFALDGASLMHFFVSLFLLGVGWNFLYVGGTTLLTETYAPAEKAKAQGFNDLLVFASMILSSSVAGFVVAGPGFPRLVWLALPFLVSSACATLLLRVRLRSAHVGELTTARS